MASMVAERILEEGSGMECMPFSYKGVFRKQLASLPDCEDEVEASRTLRKVRSIIVTEITKRNLNRGKFKYRLKQT